MAPLPIPEPIMAQFVALKQTPRYTCIPNFVWIGLNSVALQWQINVDRQWSNAGLKSSVLSLRLKRAVLLHTEISDAWPGHHRPLTGTKLYCLATETHVCEQLAQGCRLKWNGRESNRRPFESRVQRSTFQLTTRPHKF